MSLCRRPLDWDVGAINGLISNVQILEEKNQVQVFLTMSNLTSILHLDKSLNLVKQDTIECCNPVRDIILSKNKVFMLDTCDMMYEMAEAEILQENNKFDEGFCFESSESNEDTTQGQKKWKFLQTFDSVLAIIGTDTGFTCLRRLESATYIDNYVIHKENFKLTTSTQVSHAKPNSPSHMVISKLTQQFTNACFGAITQNSQEYLIFNMDPGYVAVVPVSCQLEPKTVYFQNIGALLKIIPMSSGDILLAYASGKLVLLYPDGQTLKYAKFYLPHKICAIVALDNDSLLWSDGISLKHSTILNRNRIAHFKINQNIEGVTNLVRLSHTILAVTNHNCFYTITTNESAETQIPDEPEHSVEENLNEIYRSSITIDKLQKKIQKNATMIYARATEKLENIDQHFHVKFENNEIEIKNSTGRDFLKDIWVIHVTGKYNNRNMVEIKKLRDHFINDMTIKVSIDMKNVEELKVSLIGHINDGLQLLRICLLC